MLKSSIFSENAARFSPSIFPLFFRSASSFALLEAKKIRLGRFEAQAEKRRGLGWGGLRRRLGRFKAQAEKRRLRGR